MSKKIVIIIFSLVVLATIFWLFFVNESIKAPSNTKMADTSTKTTEAPKNEFDKKKYSIDDPNSIWVVIDKKRPLPAGFKPSDLVVPTVPLRLAPAEEQMQIRNTLQKDLIEMFQASKQSNVSLVFGSGFRSDKLQKQFYDQYTAQSGQVAADTFSARPGYSEHQTGLAFDVTSASGKCHLEICFESTPEGIWIKNNSYLYGFVIRYQKGKENITGYQYEPWHLRYAGKELTKHLNETGQTLEEFFDLPVANQY